MANPVAYLYRVGQSRTRRPTLRLQRATGVFAHPVDRAPLDGALRELSEGQRVAVVLVHGFGWTAAEVAEVLGVKTTTVQSHVERGLARLRISLGHSMTDELRVPPRGGDRRCGRTRYPFRGSVPRKTAGAKTGNRCGVCATVIAVAVVGRRDLQRDNAERLATQHVSSLVTDPTRRRPL